MKILIIQNTWYHFETTISLYSSLLRLNPSQISIVQLDANYTEQENFLKQYNIPYLYFYDINIYNYDIAFIVSAYPNPFVSLENSIPLFDHPICNHYKNKIIFVSHRFNNYTDFTKHQYINSNNSISLSKLSKKINIDYWYPIEYPIKSNYQIKNNYCVQGHFEFNNRSLPPIIINNQSNSFILSIIGTTLSKTEKNPQNIYKSNLKEIDFYDHLNNQKFILAMIDDRIRNGTYIKERFSSNFNHCAALNKPIFCHEIFQDIYEIPGIYYNNHNINNKFEDLINISNEDYNKLIDFFEPFKIKYQAHNTEILSQKISNVI